MQENVFTLEAILSEIEWRQIPSACNTQISEQVVKGVCADSRKGLNEIIFVARVGTNFDGHAFLESVVANECPVIVVEDGRLSDVNYKDLSPIVLAVKNTDIAYAQMHANLCGRPGKKLQMIGITGTNGKTTISYLLEEILTGLGQQVAVIGTVNNRYYQRNGSQKIIETSSTTPDAAVIQPFLQEVLDAGVETVIMEVSSHAIAQKRIVPLLFDLVIFTNLSRDHLDYHLDMDDYFSAKALLFGKHLKESGKAVIPGDTRSLDSAYLGKLEELLSGKFINWGESDNCQLRLVKHTEKLDTTEFIVEQIAEKLKIDLKTKLVGRFNIDNLLSTFAACIALGFKVEQITSLVPTLEGAPGRLQRIFDKNTHLNKQPVVFVDYAHTPDALDKVLSTLAEIPHGRLITVFGCGGDRDKGKRPLMGATAAKFSDVVIVTEDNPRNENSNDILVDIVEGIIGKKYLLIADRKDAIAKAINLAKPDDIVLIAGKGHENYQISKNGKIFFDDAIEARNILSSWTVEKIAKATGGQIFCGTGADGYLGDICTDSRKIKAGDVFIALRGDIFDGHDYLESVIGQGASCLIVDEKCAIKLSYPHVIVSDTMKALGDLAAYRKKEIADCNDFYCVGITGSCGKTTVKEMLSSICQVNWPNVDYAKDAILRTQGNFNNLIGLPLSLLPLGYQHQAVVLEMGMNVPGEIARLAEIAQPDVVCISNIKAAHLAGLGSIDGVALAKEEIFSGSKPDTIFAVNLDDHLVVKAATKYENRKIYYSTANENGQADVWASDVSQSGISKLSFTLNYKEESQVVSLPTIGKHNINNALAAATISLAMGIEISKIAQGLSQFINQAKRMEIIEAEAGWIIISDCYNANPSSMEAGLETLATIKTGKKIAVLGDMFELGDDALAAHVNLGKFAGLLSLDFLLVVGEFASQVKVAAEETGMKGKAFAFANKEDVVSWLVTNQNNNKLSTGDTVFVKGSRGMCMETIIDQFVA